MCVTGCRLTDTKSIRLTELLWAARSRKQHLILREETTSEAITTSSRCVKLLGVYIEEDLSLSSQIAEQSALASSIYGK